MPEGELVLDLRGTPAITLRRPQLAAAGCWMFVAAVVAPFALGLVWFGSERAGITLPHWASAIYQLISQAFLPALGVRLIGFADITRGMVNPWPRRRAITAFLLLIVAEIVTICLYYGFEPEILPTTDPLADFREHSGWHDFFRMVTACDLVLNLNNFVAWALAMIYAIQTARVIRSNALMVLSFLLFIFIDLTQLIFAVWNALDVFRINSIYGSNIYHPFYKIMWEVVPIVHQISVAGYFIFCAVALHRAARRQVV